MTSKELICSDKYLKHFVHDVFFYLYSEGLLGRLRPYLTSLSAAYRLALISSEFKLRGVFGHHYLVIQVVLSIRLS